jgi:outer membrane protein OmpA-like peptidoglycan-associated protein
MRQVFFVAIASTLLIGIVFAQSANPQGSSDQPSGVPPYSPPTPLQKQVVQQNLRDMHFDFDRYDLTPADRQALEASANWLKSNPGVYVTVAGAADERGSIVYNLVLSDKRAKVTRDALVALGVPADRIVYATGWGKLYPVCNQSDETCWSENRHAHFEPWQAGSVAGSKVAPAVSESATASLSSTPKK